MAGVSAAGLRPDRVSRCSSAALKATPCYIGPPEADGLQQLNVLLGNVDRTGMLPLEILWNGSPVCADAGVRVIPPGPLVPHMLSVTDGINMMSGLRITSGA